MWRPPCARSMRRISAFGAVEARADGGDGDFEFVGDVFVGEVFHVFHEEDGFVALGQGVDGFEDGLAGLGVDDADVGGVFPGDLALHEARVFGVDGFDGGHSLVAVDPVDAEGLGDPGEPGAEFFLVVEFAYEAEGAEEDFLDYVLGFFGVSEVREDDGVDKPLVLADERAEGFAVASLGGADEPWFIDCVWLHCHLRVFSDKR